MCTPGCWLLALLGGRLAKLQYPQYTTMQRDYIPVVGVGKEIPASAANFLNIFVRFLAAIPNMLGYLLHSGTR